MKDSMYNQSCYILKLSKRLLLLARVRTPSLCDRRQTALPPAVRTGESFANDQGWEAPLKKLAFFISSQGFSGPLGRKIRILAEGLRIAPAGPSGRNRSSSVSKPSAYPPPVRLSCKIRVL
jgi:hypothetical protein